MGNLLSSLPKTIHTSIALAIILFLGLFFNNGGFEFGRDSQNVDALYQQAVSIVTQQQKASTSFIQRYLQIGYNRAARIIEHMEKEGIISEANHVGKRNVLKKN